MICLFSLRSTNREEQQNSYEAQIRYYTSYIKEQKEWEFAGIYTDFGISGTQIGKRPGFQRMLAECEAGRIDRILVKSISENVKWGIRKIFSRAKPIPDAAPSATNGKTGSWKSAPGAGKTRI